MRKEFKIGLLLVGLFIGFILFSINVVKYKQLTDSMIKQYAAAFPNEEEFSDLMDLEDVDFRAQYSYGQYAQDYEVFYTINQPSDSYLFAVDAFVETKDRYNRDNVSRFNLYRQYKYIADEEFEKLDTKRDDIKMYYAPNVQSYKLYAFTEDENCLLYYKVYVRHTFEYNDESVQKAIKDTCVFFDYIKENLNK